MMDGAGAQAAHKIRARCSSAEKPPSPYPFGRISEPRSRASFCCVSEKAPAVVAAPNRLPSAYARTKLCLHHAI